MGIGDWGLGIGDWGLGIGPNPQSPIPNPHPQSPFILIQFFKIIYLKINKYSNNDMNNIKLIIFINRIKYIKIILISKFILTFNYLPNQSNLLFFIFYFF